MKKSYEKNITFKQIDLLVGGDFAYNIFLLQLFCAKWTEDVEAGFFNINAN